MASLVFALCAVTSVACAFLLMRTYLRRRNRLLMWSGLCFIGLGLNNIALFVDEVIAPEYDLRMWRAVPAILGLSVLAFGLVWETRR